MSRFADRASTVPFPEFVNRGSLACPDTRAVVMHARRETGRCRTEDPY
jgi:hypothetical protein